MTDEAHLRDLARKSDPRPWIRMWATLKVHSFRGNNVLSYQENVDFAVAAVHHYDECMARAVADVEEALRESKSYNGWSVAADGPGYVARSGELTAWSVSDPELVTDPDQPATPTKALRKLVVLIRRGP